jgi:hypothetical protein
MGTYRSGYRGQSGRIDGSGSPGDSLANGCSRESVNINTSQPVGRAGTVSGKVSWFSGSEQLVHFGQRELLSLPEGGPEEQAEMLTCSIIAKSRCTESGVELLRNDQRPPLQLVTAV